MAVTGVNGKRPLSFALALHMFWDVTAKNDPLCLSLLGLSYDNAQFPVLNQ